MLFGSTRILVSLTPFLLAIVRFTNHPTKCQLRRPCPSATPRRWTVFTLLAREALVAMFWSPSNSYSEAKNIRRLMLHSHSV